MAPPYRLMEPGENDVRVPTATGRNAVGGAASVDNAAAMAQHSPLRAARWPWPLATSDAPGSGRSRPKRMRVNYQPLDDTPDKVEAAIRRNTRAFEPRQE